MAILSGFFKTKKYRKTTDGYKLESNWTSGNTVELDDGNTVQNNLGAIKGITTSTSVTETGYAADATTVAALNESLDEYEYAYEYKTISSGIQLGSMKYGNIKFGLSYPDGYNFVESITPILNLPGQATVYDNGNIYNICVFNCTDTTRTYTVKVLIKYTKQVFI